MSRRHRRSGGRTTPTGTPPRRAKSRRRDFEPYTDDEPDLLAEVREALAGEPLDLLAQASSLVAALTSPPNPFERSAPDLASLDEVVASLLEVDQLETTALLMGAAPLLDDRLLAKRIERTVAARPYPLPAWLRSLAEVRAVRAQEMVHALGDGDNIYVELHGPDLCLTVLTYIDHNLGTAIKDAFVLPGPIAEVEALYRAELGDDPNVTWRDIALANARARLEEADLFWSRLVPRIANETWPACRPMLRWALRLLPAGGTGYPQAEWSDQAMTELGAAFLTSPHAAGLDEDQQSLVEQLLWFGTGYNVGGPLRWSPVVVERFLLDWLSRKVVAPREYLEGAPGVVRAFVAFAHERTGVPASLTAETTSVVDQLEGEYRRSLARAANDEDWDDEVRDDEDDDWDIEEFAFPTPETVLGVIANAVGGVEVLHALDAAPLPDEPFSWDGVVVDIRDEVAKVLMLHDAAADRGLGPEFRTAGRRLLHRIASEYPVAFRRGARPEGTAAAVGWIIAKANGLFDGYRFLVKDFLAGYGVSGSVSQRANVMLRGIGEGDGFAYSGSLGDPGLLMSGTRAQIIADRDMIISLAEEWPTNEGNR